MGPKVSIIIPVYNAEKYLRHCIDSVLGQEYRDFELLLVNDGSTDTSGAICEEYSRKDPRVRVTHKENTGVSDTRNLAISQARGKYLQFVDSDDWLTSDATRLLVKAAEENGCDLVISDFYRVVGERVSHKGDIETDGVMSREEFAAHMMEDPADFYYGVLWNKLYRREIVEKYNICMEPSISWCEDFLFNLEYILHAERFYALQIPVYYYVKTKGSLVSQGNNIARTIKMKRMVFEYYNNFYKNVLSEEEYEKQSLRVYRFFVDVAGDAAVPPVFSEYKKLGMERASVYAEAMDGDGILMEAYRNRKLMEYYLEPTTLKYDLTLAEAKLLLQLSCLRLPLTKRELQDFSGLTARQLSLTLQKLAVKGLIAVEEKASEKRKNRLISISLTGMAQPILRELEIALERYEEAKYDGFREEELMEYARLSEKIRKNIRRIL